MAHCVYTSFQKSDARIQIAVTVPTSSELDILLVTSIICHLS